MRRRRLSDRRKALYAAVAAIAVLGLAEAAARALWEPVPAALGTAGMQHDPHPTRIWALRPGETRQFGSPALVGADGLRVVPPRDGALRALTLGDSSVFGHGLADADTLHVRLADALAAQGAQVDVRCGGVPGYSTEQTLILMDEVGWSLEPDLLVVANLWSDGMVEHFTDREWIDALRSPGGRGNWVLSRSAGYRWLSYQLAGQSLSYHAVSWVRPPKLTAAPRVSVGDYRENLERLLDDAAARGVGAIFLQYADAARLRGEPVAARYLDAQRELADARGLPAVDGLAVLRASGLDESALFLDDLHPTARTNALYAEALAAALSEAGWPEERLAPR